MLTEEFIISVYCLVDDTMKNITENQKPRQRGPSPELADSETITILIVGECLGLNGDKAIHRYFSEHWRHFFPKIPGRPSFVKQCANLWGFIIRIWERVKGSIVSGTFRLVDGIPMSVCKTTRVNSSKLFKGIASWGYCAAKDEKYYGLKLHLSVDETGIISGAAVTAANADEREAMLDFSGDLSGKKVIGDKGYICSGEKRSAIESSGADLVTPFRKNMVDTRPRLLVKTAMRMRRIIETVGSQLAGRFNISKVIARDLWHLSVRIYRKILAHTVCCFILRSNGFYDLDFDSILST